MGSAILDPGQDSPWQINPETMEVLESYLLYGDVSLVAKELHIPKQKVTYYLGRPESKRFLDQIYMESGYLNRNRLQDILAEVMELKLEEIRESEMGSKKDIADLIALAHKIRTDEAKISGATGEGSPSVKTQVNIQNNTSSDFGSNYNSLLEKLVK